MSSFSFLRKEFCAFLLKLLHILHPIMQSTQRRWRKQSKVVTLHIIISLYKLSGKLSRIKLEPSSKSFELKPSSHGIMLKSRQNLKKRLYLTTVYWKIGKNIEGRFNSYDTKKLPNCLSAIVVMLGMHPMLPLTAFLQSWYMNQLIFVYRQKIT